MVKLIWSPRAAADLEEICNYIALDSEHYARLFAQRIVTLIFQNYRIVYRIKEEAIEIVAIVHGARLLLDV
jgi:toxin ParE1/3/4